MFVHPNTTGQFQSAVSFSQLSVSCL